MRERELDMRPEMGNTGGKARTMTHNHDRRTTENQCRACNLEVDKASVDIEAYTEAVGGKMMVPLPPNLLYSRPAPDGCVTAKCRNVYRALITSLLAPSEFKVALITRNVAWRMLPVTFFYACIKQVVKVYGSTKGSTLFYTSPRYFN